jgi:hypothetical protein
MREKDTISGQERTLRWSRFDAGIYTSPRTKGRQSDLLPLMSRGAEPRPADVLCMPAERATFR